MSDHNDEPRYVRPFVDGQDPSHFDQLQAEALEVIRTRPDGFLLFWVDDEGQLVFSACMRSHLVEGAVMSALTMLAQTAKDQGWDLECTCR